MKVWFLGLGEALPTDIDTPRQLRTGMMANILVERGHEVLWWNSNFHHAQKYFRSSGNIKQNVCPGYDVMLLQGRAYPRNISYRRVLHNRDVRKEFVRLSAAEEKPDIILSCSPIVELCQASVAYGRKWDIPVVIDIRDFWPDVIVGLAPKWAQPLARILCAPMIKDFQSAIRGATAVCGISDGAVDWALNHVERKRSVRDRSFPLSYQEQELSENEIAEADDYWATLGLPSDHSDFLAIYFGKLSPRDEVHTVVQAAQHLKKQNLTNIKFVICGSGDALEPLRRQAKDLDNVILTGWVDYPKMWSLLQRASVGLMPYRSSPDYSLSVPNKVAEYLSAGLPVISSLHGDLSELLAKENCGVTYENENASELAQIMSDLSTDKDRVTEISKNALRVFERFRAENVYGQYCDFLQEVAESGSLN